MGTEAVVPGLRGSPGAGVPSPVRLRVPGSHGSHRFSYSESGEDVRVSCRGCGLRAVVTPWYRRHGEPVLRSAARAADRAAASLVADWTPDCPLVPHLDLVREVMSS